MDLQIETSGKMAMGADFALIESLLWNRTLYREDDHLDRLSRSAREFGIPLDQRFVRNALQQYCRSIEETGSFKVRILLNNSGELHMSHHILEGRKFGKVTLARERVASTNPFLLHKSNRRELYDAIYPKARLLQFDDALFFNERDELTEGCIHNVFIEQGGMLLTPPISCGLLPGVFRQNVLARNGRARERILKHQDVLVAEKIYLCNSVRGMYRVKLIAETEI